MGRNIIIKRKLRLADGRIVDGELAGVKGGDVEAIWIRYYGKWVHPSKLKGRKYPIKTLTETPFLDIDVYKKKR